MKKKILTVLLVVLVSSALLSVFSLLGSPSSDECSHITSNADVNVKYYDVVAVSKSATCAEKGAAVYRCKLCGERVNVVLELDDTVHNNLEPVSGKDSTCYEDGYTDYEKCQDCGAFIGYEVVGSKSHKISGYSSDENSHWMPCENDGCTFIYKKATHSFSVKYNNEQHYEKCACGVNRNYAAHSLHLIKYDSSTHCQGCDCGYIASDSFAAHNEVFVGDDTNHWLECGCGYKSSSEAHNFSLSYDSVNHFESCQCGAARNAEAHELAYCSDDTTHWTECECGYVSEPVEHNFEIVPAKDSTCYEYGYTEHNECTDCGFAVGYEVVGMKAHSFSASLYGYDEDTHWYACQKDGCTFKYVETEHTLTTKNDENGHWYECAECGYVSEPEAHIGTEFCTVCKRLIEGGGWT